MVVKARGEGLVGPIDDGNDGTAMYNAVGSYCYVLLMRHILLEPGAKLAKDEQSSSIEVQIEVQIERGHRVPGLNFRIISNLPSVKKYSMANIGFTDFFLCEDLGR